MGDKVRITFKAKLNKSGNHYYIYVPKEWNDEIREIHQRKRKVIVTIEVKE